MTPAGLAEPVDWQEGIQPHSPRFGERYRSHSGALAQAATVFLGGCGLPQAWRGQRRHTVLETGFGLGINFLATWAAWEADPARCDTLVYVGVEAYPVAVGDLLRSAAQALAEPGVDQARWCRLPALAAALGGTWPALRQGLQTWPLAQGQVQLTLAVGDVLPMLDTLDVRADSVFLDGFSPQVNPQMWAGATLAAVARHCAPGARLATYTTQRSVREGLAAEGFDVRRRPGLAPKRRRLEAALARGGVPPFSGLPPHA